MDRRRRCRNRRGHSLSNSPQNQEDTLQNTKPWSFLSGFYSILILSSLIALIYMMLDYQCSACAARCDLSYINKNLNNISTQMAIVQDYYNNLEIKVSQFSQQIPKLEGQVEILEGFIKAVEKRTDGWDPQHLPLPNVDVILQKTLKCGQNFCKNPADTRPNPPSI